MPKKTKVREKLPGHVALLKSLKKSGVGSLPVYGALISALETLESVTSSLYTPDKDGNFKPLDENGRKQLIKQYNDAMLLSRQACSVDDREGPYRSAVNALMADMDTDMALLNGALTGDTTLPELVEQRGGDAFSSIEMPGNMEPLGGIDLEIPEDASLSYEGGALSKRKLLSFTDGNGVEHRGYYTSRIELDYQKNAALTFLEARMAYPRYSDYLCLLEDYYAEDHNYGAGDKIVPGFSEGDLAELKKDPAFVEMSDSLKRNLRSISSTQSNYFNNVGAGVGETVEMRNVGMTRMAELMGNEKLLAKSVPMRLKQGDRIEDGVFMESAEGLDIAKQLPGSPMENYTEDVYNYGPGLKSLSDIQVLDYICSNTDRHHGNMLYSFSEIDGQPRFTGAMGIDNDMSFLSRNAKEHSPFVAITNMLLDGITCISEEQADFIQNCDPDRVCMALKGCRLSADTTEAVIERIGKLKERIENKSIQVLSDEEWNHKTLSDLEYENNIFSKVKGVLLGENVKNLIENNAERKKPAGVFIKGEVKQFSDQQVQTARERAAAKQAETEAGAIAGEQLGSRKIISDRVAMAGELKAERAERSLVKDPFRKERVGEIREKMDRLEAAFKKADHFFGGSDEYDRAVSSFRDMQKFMDKAVFGKGEKNVQLMEEAREEFSYLLETAKALKEKTVGNSRANQADRYEFACRLEEFSDSFLRDIKEYDMALLQNQDDLIENQRTERVKEVFAYGNKLFGGKTFDPSKDSEILQHTITTGIDALSNSIYEGQKPDEAVALNLTAAVLLYESIQHASRQNADRTAALTTGKNRSLMEVYKKDPAVMALARDLVDNPGGFAQDLVNGNLDPVYHEFIEHGAVPGSDNVLNPEAPDKAAPSTSVDNSAQAKPKGKAMGK